MAAPFLPLGATASSLDGAKQLELLSPTTPTTTSALLAAVQQRTGNESDDAAIVHSAYRSEVAIVPEQQCNMNA